MLPALITYSVALLLLGASLWYADHVFCLSCSEWRTELTSGEHSSRFCPVCLSERSELL